MFKEYDLHVHSTYSDGKYNLFELANLAKSNGLKGFALTDHDTIEGWQDIPLAMAQYQIKIFPSVEISTAIDESDIHILAFGINNPNKHFKEMLQFQQEARIKRIKSMIEKLKIEGFDITEEDVFKESRRGVPGRPHIGRVMVAKGYVKTVQEAFDKYLLKGRSCYITRSNLKPETALEIISENGGFGVMAHPVLDNAKRFAPDLAERGLKGLEVYHSKQTNTESRKLSALAQDLNIAMTGGSDFHGGERDKNNSIGSHGLNENELPIWLQKELN